MNRRDALKTSLALGGGVLATRLAPEAVAGAQRVDDRIPKKGEEWNESFLFPDEATTRLTRRLTSRRTFNHKPTYHINQGFSPDDQHLVFCTYAPGGGSALVRANVETGDLKAIDHAEAGDEFQFDDGNALGLIPGTPLVAYSRRSEIRLYDLFSLEKTVLVPPSGGSGFGYPAGTCDGRAVIVPLHDVAYDWRKERGRDPYGVLGVTYYRIDLASGRMTEVFRDDGRRGMHAIPNPVDPDLAIIDRDSPPRFEAPNCGADVPRNWVLRLSTGEATPIVPRNGCHFTWHTNWNHTGDHVYYHGPSARRKPRWLAERYGEDYPGPYRGKQGDAHFIGVATAAGETVWEREYPVVYYGHVSAHATRDAIILDKLIAPDLFTALHWREVDAQGIPRMEVLGKHNSGYAHGHASHPH